MSHASPPRTLVSIIIDNFNYARFLPDAIESALAQTYPHIEVIVVDDGSTDDSRAVIQRYGGRLRSVFKANGGQGSAFNAGFDVSRGDIVLFLDSDDILHANAATRVVTELAGRPFVKAQWQLEAIDEQGKPLARLVPGRPPAEGDLRAAMLENGPSSIVSSPTSGNAWQRTFLRQVMPVPEDVRYYRRSADEYLFNLAAALGLVRTIEEPLGQYRIHLASQYSARSFDEKLQIELAGFDEQCVVLERFFRARGITADIDRWHANSWWRRLERAVGDVRAHVPASETFILIDDGTWGMGSHDQPRPLPLMMHDGLDWGPPGGDEEAIAALRRHWQANVRYLAFAWPAFWWVAHYPELLRHLTSQHRFLVETDDLMLFRLSENPASWQNQSPTFAGVDPTLVSIVISSFNYAQFLPEAIGSALDQSHPSVEVVVVDDGSTDASRQIIASFGNRVRPVLKANGGQGSAINAGFAACRGDVVILLDSDDVLLPHAAASAAAAFQADAGAVKVHWPVAAIDAAGARTGRVYPNGELPEGDLLDLVLREGPDGYPWPPTSGNAWRRTFLEAVLPMPEELFRTCPDLYLTAWSPFLGTIRRVVQPQTCWRVHGANHSWNRSFDERLAGLVAKWEAMFASLADHCRSRGIDVDVENWRQKSWFHRIQRAVNAITQLVADGQTFILADGDEWECGSTVGGRRRFAFLEGPTGSSTVSHPTSQEANGMYWGPPADDAQAISELQRLCRRGAGYFVFAWPTFWWLDHYRGLKEFLDREAIQLRADADLVIYDLRSISLSDR